MNKKFFAAVLGVALVLPVVAKAEAMYVIAGVGQSEYTDAHADGISYPDLNATAGQIGVGYMLDKTWGAELGYIHFGSDSSSSPSAGTGTLSVKNQTIYLAGIGKLPLSDSFSIFGKLGIAVNNSKGNASGVITSGSYNISEDKTKTTALIGVGAGYQFTKELEGYVDYSYFGKVSDTNIKLSLISVGVRYGF